MLVKTVAQFTQQMGGSRDFTIFNQVLEVNFSNAIEMVNSYLKFCIHFL